MGNAKKNFAYQSIYQLLTMLLPLITAPYIARVLGSENSGIYSYTYTVSNYFVVFAMLGLEQYGNRSIARVRDNEQLKNQTFSELLILHIFISLIITTIYYMYVIFFSDEYKLIALIQGIYLLSAVFDVNWFFFGIEKFKITVTRNIIIKLLSVVGIFIFVNDRSDLRIYALIMSLSMFISQLILWYYIPQYVSFKKVSFKGCISHIQPLFILFIAVIAANIYRMIDKVMLGWFDQMNDLGCYDYADKIIRIPLSLITALGTVMLPKMSNLFSTKSLNQVEKILDISALFVLFMSFAMAFGIAGIAPEFVIIYLGNEYQNSIRLITILAITIPLIAWNNYIRTQLLIPLQKDKIYTIGVCVGAAINFCFNMIFIPLFGATGAATVTIFSYTAVLLIQTIPLIKDTNVLRYLRYIPFPLTTGILMFIILRLIGRFMGISIITVICQLIVGMLFYVCLSLIYLFHVKRELFEQYKNKIINKVNNQK